MATVVMWDRGVSAMDPKTKALMILYSFHYFGDDLSALKTMEIAGGEGEVFCSDS